MLTTAMGHVGSQRNSIIVDCTEITKGHRSGCQVGTYDNCTVHLVKDLTIQIKLHLPICNNFSSSHEVSYSVTGCLE